MAPSEKFYWQSEGAAAPRCLIVMCHGVEATGEQMTFLGPLLHEAIPGALFLAPNAPFPFSTRLSRLMPWVTPPGWQWYALKGLGAPEADSAFIDVGADVAAAAESLGHMIDDELARLDLPADAYALLGFSQGAIMALHFGLRRAVPPAAIVSFGGGVMAPNRLRSEIRARPPVLLIHGDADEVISVQRTRTAERALKAAGVPTETLYRHGGEHPMEAEGIAAAGAFLRRALGERAEAGP